MDRDARQYSTGQGDVARNSSARGAEGIRIPLREEELVAGKRVEEQGRVNVHKDVVTEQETVRVPVQREQVSVERVSVDQAVTDADAAGAFQEEDISVPVMGEEVVTGKRAHVVEEVRLHKDQVTEAAQVSDTVRKEQVRVDEGVVAPPQGGGRTQS